jgi:transcriptional regulator with XRE-family HTH domain
MEQSAIGRELRARRTAAGRTVASVAVDAGLSVPYIANLENGRGNPTITALTRLTSALGLHLAITLEPQPEPGPELEAGPGPGPRTGPGPRPERGLEPGARSRATPPEIPASLVRLGRTARFRRTVETMAAALELAPDELSVQLVETLAALAHTMGRDLAEPDWWRLLDALLLIAAHPAT